MESRIELHQERNFSERLNTSFAFMKQNFKGLFKPMFFVALPVSLLAGYFMSNYFSFIFGNLYSNSFDSPTGIVKIISSYIGLFVCILIGFLLLVCIVLAYISLYDEHKENTVSVFTRVKERIGRFIGYNIVYGILFSLVFALGTLVLVAPPIFLMTNSSYIGLGAVLLFMLILVYFVLLFLLASFMYLLQCVLFYEKRGLGDTLSRTFQIMKGYWWSTTGYLFLVSFIANIAYGIFYIPLYILLIISGFGIGMGSGPVNEVALIVTSMITTLGGFMITPLIYLFFSLQYYNLVEKVDATGLLKQLGQLGKDADESDDQSYL